MLRRLVIVAVLVGAVAAVRHLVLARNEERLGNEKTPYGPDRPVEG